MRNIARSDVIKGPYSGTQLDHLSRMLRESDIIVSTIMNREKKVAAFLSELGHHLKNPKIKFNFMRTGQKVIKRSRVIKHFNDDLKIVICQQGDLLKGAKAKYC
ncbi:hypothetical protein Acr_28g0009530 [Actinidia rufa]|uniref:Uncharacterized protein n=1 Tax=Actinidia rufa TaxID=165716 RepID=A0A7J0HB49_9ERIC|nr:hypothetical protein Acr_28g0009530 [Actinidia rufa]